MGLFGSSKAAGAYNPNAMSGSDRMMLFGAMLSDLGKGDGPQNIMAVRQMLGQQALLRQQQSADQDAIGMFNSGPADPNAPTPVAMPAQSFAASPQTGMPALNLPQVNAAPAPSGPRMPDISNAADMLRLATLAGRGSKIAPTLMDLAKANKAPDPLIAQTGDGRFFNSHDASSMNMAPSINNQIVGDQVRDMNSAKTTGTPVIKTDNGQYVVWDQGVPHLRNVEGAPQAAAETAGAVSSAQEGAKAGLDIVSVPMGDGSTQQMTRAQAAQFYAHGLQGGAGQGAPPGFGRTQTPSEVATTAAATSAKIDLPQVIAQGQNMLGLIKSITTDPALATRTGILSKFPAIDGTPGAAFDSKVAQLKGKAFMDAYAGLKGSGQISEIEGAKATDAQARLQTAQSPKDYVAALNDLASVVQAGITRAQAKAGGAPQGAKPAFTAPPPRSVVEAELRRRGLIR